MRPLIVAGQARAPGVLHLDLPPVVEIDEGEPAGVDAAVGDAAVVGVGGEQYVDKAQATGANDSAITDAVTADRWLFDVFAPMHLRHSASAW